MLVWHYIAFNVTLFPIRYYTRGGKEEQAGEGRENRDGRWSDGAQKQLLVVRERQSGGGHSPLVCLNRHNGSISSASSDMKRHVALPMVGYTRPSDAHVMADSNSRSP